MVLRKLKIYLTPYLTTVEKLTQNVLNPQRNVTHEIQNFLGKKIFSTWVLAIIFWMTPKAGKKSRKK